MRSDTHFTADRADESLGQGAKNLTLVFLGHTSELVDGLGPDGAISHPCHRRASIKDIIEAHGVPHTEVGRIVSGDRECDFRFIPVAGDTVVIYPFDRSTPLFQPTALRPQPLLAITFLADRTLGKLVRNLRLAGIDTNVASLEVSREIAREAAASRRVLLSRNRDLLKIRQVVHGQLIRSSHHDEQMLEILDRFPLQDEAQPLSRCLACNQVLEPVEKQMILHELEPLTQRYYHEFSRCRDCGRIYWQGTHYTRLQEMLRKWF